MAIILNIPGVKRDYVAGMHWRHEKSHPSKKSLKEGAMGKDFWVTTRKTSGGSTQSGFCSPVMDVNGKPFNKKVYSLAADVADALKEPWLGVFDIGQGLYWYIAVRDSYEILPDGDVVGDYATVQSIRDEHDGLGKWDLTKDGGLEDIAQLLRMSKRHSRVYDVRKNPALIPIIGVATVTALSVGGAYYSNLYQERLEAEQHAQQIRRMALMRAEMEKKAAEDVPWNHYMAPDIFLRNCASALNAVPIFQDGWAVDVAECSQIPYKAGYRLNLSIGWSRYGGTDLEHPFGLLADHGNKLATSSTFKEVFPADKTGSLTSYERLYSEFMGVSQVLGVKASIKHTTPPLIKKGMLPPVWSSHPFTVSVPYYYLMGSNHIWNINGLRISKVTVKSSGMAEISGNLYNRIR